ncbi:tetratricopeptide repeat protein [Candidatus Parabeggiatoa sp. HSG14]|uniref:tetratricopeptide repeat protein n=1 Tax=Candidatus Parabeggiatoa sp. HSG14 TaxID=3055593 RepID=UPI0025A89F44|nr:tetratricopeptide repeat protein [Thiotrichales bacterium HSG14]
MFKINSFHIPQLIYGSLFFLILIITVGLYWQGLQGIFLLDDEANLQELANVTKETSSIIFFTLEGISSQLGRPVSLFTFALQANDWPLNPFGFKYVNLMIHLLNGCLVFWLILLITRIIALPEKRSLLLALLTTTVWLLHPLQVSTVLYVVQRMTQLSALFTLTGLLVYLQGRQLMAQDKLKSGFFWISFSVIFGGLLATLSKENGILLVLYIIVLEATVLRALPKPRFWQAWASVFLYLPLILLAFYFIAHIDSLLQGYETRHFTMGERLLTQASVLTDYIAKILLLRPYGFGLYHDDFPISHSLLTPPTTLIAVSFIVVMFVIAVWVRRLWPVFAFGILWFFAGHILESSFIGLVLYFEHRNYLPMLGIIFLAFYGILKLFDYILDPYLRKIAISLSVFWLALFPLITWSQTDLWSKPIVQTAFWVHQSPKSLAAQSHAVVFFLRSHDHAQAEAYTQEMIEFFPEHTAPYLYLISLSCLSEKTRLPDMQQTIRHFKTSKHDRVTPQLLTFILEERKMGHCQLDSNTIDKMLNTLIHNPNNAGNQANFYHRYAMFHVFEKSLGLAIPALKQALALKDKLQWRLDLIELLMENEQFDEAKAYLQETRVQLNPIKAYLYEKELELLEARISVKE